ncbi:MAG TPA: UxaA family hydrolase [Tissierellaceae bacterium]
MNKVLKIDKKDNVVTCTEALQEGDVIDVEGEKIIVKEDIDIFHKIAIEDIKKGEICYKYGEIIGDALEDISKGEHVHVHNIESTRGRGDK